MKDSDVKYNKKNPVVSFRVDTRTLKALKKHAKEMKETLAECIARIVWEYLK